jgi:hypothetical protein
MVRDIERELVRHRASPPTPLERRAFELIGVPIPIELSSK